MTSEADLFYRKIGQMGLFKMKYCLLDGNLAIFFLDKNLNKGGILWTLFALVLSKKKKK